MGPSSSCKVETFGVFCTKPSSHFLCQGSLQVQRDLPGKGWLMGPSGKQGDSAPCPAGGWNMRVRWCNGGIWAHEPMPGTTSHHLSQMGVSQPTQGRLRFVLDPHCGEYQGFPKHLYLLQSYFKRDFPSWTGLWAAGFSRRCPCPSQGFGTRWSLKSFPTQTRLWFYD